MRVGRNSRVLLGTGLLILSGLSSPRQTKRIRPMVIVESSHNLSPPLRELQTAAVHTVSQVPYGDLQAEFGRWFPSPLTNPLMPKPVVKESAVGQVLAPLGLNFEGIDAPTVGRVHPVPDPNGAVGATQYVQAVNWYFAVFDKSNGALLLGPTPLVNLWSGMGSPCGTSGEGDPIVQYDKLANRWIISHHATLSTGSYYECIAVSTTSDATGSFYRYAFQVSNDWPDYPKMGVWPDAYYFSYDLFDPSNGNGFLGTLACAYDRTAMLQGNAATSVCFQLAPGFGNRLLPSDLEICLLCSTGSSLPSPGEPNFFLNLATNDEGLNLWRFHVDFKTPQNSTFTGPTLVGAARFTPACFGGYHICIPQLGTSQGLDVSGGSGLPPVGLMYRLSYRHFPGGPEVLLAVHSIAPQARLRWYEIRDAARAPWIHQQGTFAPDSNYRWHASIAMDKLGDVAIGYSVSSATMNPAIRYTGRVPIDPPGTLEAEASIIEGTGSEIAGHGWGDYSSLSIDPEDDCTFWYTNEYLQTYGSLNWKTRIASFKFPSCN